MPSRKRMRSRTRSRSKGRMVTRSVTRRARRKGVRVTGVHNFTRGMDSINEEINGVYLARYYTRKFNDMTAYGEFTNLFDNYKITKIQMTFQLITNPTAVYYTNLNNTSSGNNSNWFPKMWYVRDYDGGSTETISSMKERQGVKCRILEPNKMIKISFVPRVRTLIYKTSTTEGYAPKSIKLDMTDVEVPHYGLHVVWDTNGIDVVDTVPFKINVETKFFFSCSGVR